MANRIVIFKNNEFDQLSDGWQLLLESLDRFVPGSRLESVSRLDQLGRVLSIQKHGVLVVPLLGANHERICRLQLELKKDMPYPFFFSIVFLLIESGSSRSLSGRAITPEWIGTLDEFYDQAIPVQLIYCSGVDADAHTFNIAASLSSLLRQVDSMEEMRRLNDAVSDMESQIKAIQTGLTT